MAAGARAESTFAFMPGAEFCRLGVVDDGGLVLVLTGLLGKPGVVLPPVMVALPYGIVTTVVDLTMEAPMVLVMTAV